jgi:hypothetical protein
MMNEDNMNSVERLDDGKYAAKYRNSGHRYMKTLMQGERRIHTTLLLANPPNINKS